jgi:hypothetical protein
MPQGSERRLAKKVVETLITEDVARQGGRSDGVVLITRAQVEDAITESTRRGKWHAVHGDDARNATDDGS